MATIPCPTCQAPVAIDLAERPATFPFCSQRCRTGDLAAWAEGRHAVPGRDLHEVLDDPDLDRL